MTALASAGDLRMIHQWIHRRPRDTVMTGLTNICRSNVRGTLARGRGAIMTGDAGVGGS